MVKIKKAANKVKKNSLKKKLKSTDQVSSEKSLHDLPQQSFDFNSLRAFRYCISPKFSAERNLFIKRDPSDIKCIIVVNIPQYLSLDSIKQIFIKHIVDENLIEDVVLQRSTSQNGDLREGYKTVGIRLNNSECVQNVLERCEGLPLACLSDDGIDLLPCGLEKYVEEYWENYIPTEELQKRVDEFMSAYDNKMLEETRKAKDSRNVPDDEGWITVTRKGNKRKPPPAVVSRNQSGADRAFKKKKIPKEDIAFYSFQLRESKLKHLEELRAKFEEDKKKIALARAMRKFRPD